MLRLFAATLCCSLGLCLTIVLPAAEPTRTPILLDTDFGTEIDDAFALALAVASPEMELVGVTTVTGDTQIRAKMVCRFLHAVGREKVPVAAGAAPQAKSEITGQYQYYYHPALLYGRAGKPQKESAVEFLYEQLKARPGELTIVAIGPLTNIARLLEEHPDAKPWIKRIVVMGGSVEMNYDGEREAITEWNIKTDIPAAQKVFAAGMPLTVVPVDATWNMQLEYEAREKLFAKRSLLTMQLEALYQMWNQETPVLYDPLAVTSVVDFAELKELPLTVTDDGRTRVSPGKPQCAVAVRGDAKKFVPWCAGRLIDFGPQQLPRELKNRTELITDNRFPARVHTFEDYETDIEKRWWLAGRLEEDNIPQYRDNTRAFRSQLTLDFDDLQGQLDTMYSAVVFNPVPGPPMGPQTRLKFRYYLEGTDELRIQIYSLSNGYHRYLSLKGLPQGEWKSATVDMTAARRPDGSGGPLADNERIDDIQFYAVPSATIHIDEIILYDAGDETEKRPFPKDIHYTGWFDTGKQGVEWPGTFEIVEHEKPRAWKFARSMEKVAGKAQTLIVSLRGARPLGKDVRLNFDYRLSGDEQPLAVELVDRESGRKRTATIPSPQRGEWTSAALELTGAASQADELHFVLRPGQQLAVDNVLLYEP